MARKIVGLDIGTTAVRAAELSVRRGRVVLDRLGQTGLPPGAVVDGEVADPPAVTAAIKALWRHARIGSKHVGDVTTYQCRTGDVFLSGTLRGRLTIAAENNIVVVDDTTYSTSGAASNDLLGLIANQFVQVYHPVNASGTNITPTFQDPQIHAAILALGHSFIVQNYDEGAKLGTLNVNGVIAQKWRGPVGTGGGSGTGYLKAYGYDTRLQYASPPHAMDGFTAPFRVSQWAEIPNPTGLPA